MLSFLNSLLRSVRNYFWIFIFSKIVPNPTKKELESEKVEWKRRKARIPENQDSKLTKAFPKHIAALDKRSVLAKVNSQGSGT